MEKTEGKWEIISNGKTRQMPDYKDDNTAYIDWDAEPVCMSYDGIVEHSREYVNNNADILCTEEEYVFSVTRLPDFIKDTRLSLAAKELLLYLQAEHDEGRNLGCMSLEEISRICRKDEFTVWTAWKELKKFGYAVPYVNRPGEENEDDLILI